MTKRSMFEMVKAMMTGISDEVLAEYLPQGETSETVFTQAEHEIEMLNRANGHKTVKETAAMAHNGDVKNLIAECFASLDAPVTFSEFWAEFNPQFDGEPRGRVVSLMTAMVKEGRLHKSESRSASVYFC